MDFGTNNLGGLNLDDVFGDEVNRPWSWTKFRLFCSKLAADLNFALGVSHQAIDMADAAHGLVGDNAGSAETVVSSSVLLVDPNSAGASEDLTLNQASCPVGKYHIVNTGGESIVVKNTGGDTIVTITTGTAAIVYNDGSALYALLGA